MSLWSARASLVTVLLAAMVSAPTTGATGTADEYELKGALLLNFARLARWPETSFVNSESPLILAVVGRDPFGDDFQLAARRQLVGGRAVELRRCRRPSDVSDAHLVFFVDGGSEVDQGELARLHARHVLTVGETESFLERGGSIRMALEERRIRVHVSIRALDEAGVKLRSQLLRIATLHRLDSQEEEGSR